MANNQMINRIKKFIADEKLLAPKDTVIMGVSGGADSVCLLEIFNEIKDDYELKLICVSINHGLRPEAKEEVAYVEKLCKEREIEFLSKNIDVMTYSKNNNLGTEEAARILRYRIFDDISKEYPGSKIAVAHNKNDLSETFLFNLFRGTGPKGLGAMRPKRDNIIRPLLAVERVEIEEYLNSKAIGYYTDSSNLTDEYSRNKIRHHILNYAADELNNQAVSHIADTADKVRKLNDLVEKLAEEKLEASLIKRKAKEVIIEGEVLRSEDPYLANIIVKKCIDMLVPNNKDICGVHLDSVRMLVEGSEMKQANLPYKISATYSGGKVRFARGEDEEESVAVTLEGEKGELEIPSLGRVLWHLEIRPEDFSVSEKKYTKCFDYDKISQSLCFRYGTSEDFITVNDKLQKKKLFDYLKNEKVPVFEREKTWVLADGNQIWWVIGRRIGELPKVRENTEKILYIEMCRED